MKQHREERIALATRIYELDGEVYRCLGSSLGRVFTGKRDATIEELARLMGGGSITQDILDSAQELLDQKK